MGDSVTAINPKRWKCAGCGAELATVNAQGEACFTGCVILRCQTAIAICPACGAANVWAWRVKPLTEREIRCTL